MIRVQELSKRYGELRALDGLEFELGRGEILGLLGPNGAGKTTALRLLTGFMPPDAGCVTIDGRDLRDLGADLRRRSGYLPESNPLYGDLSVRQNLAFWGAVYGLAGADLEAALGRVIRACGLAGRADQAARELSKGYRQRLGLAQALVHDPEIVFLDEPTAGLDPLNVRDLRGMIRDFAGAKTVILCTHVLPEVEAVCDRVLILDRGRTVLAGSLAELGRRYAAAGVHEVLVAPPPGGLDWSGAPGLLSSEALPAEGELQRWRVELAAGAGDPAALAAWLVGSGAGLHALRPSRAGLEEVFLSVVGGERGA